METLLQTLRNLGPMRLSIMGGVVFGLIAFFIFLSTRLASPQMALLYGDLDTNDATRIAAQLDAQSVPYELRKNGTEVHVPADQVSRMRLTMAQQGLPSGGTVGYELFDSADSLGSTDFVQNINLVRALEGELARTIGAIESVRSARVHLVMPRRELFSREKQEPSASIVLKMKGISRLDRGQVTAIQHLVAAAVPKLTPNRISIIDDKGSLLAGGFEDLNDPATAAVKTEERKRTYENRMARTVEELLERAVGFGRVRAEVRADMDFDRISTSEEQYNPDGQVVRSTQTVEENSSSREADPQSVTVANNLPDPNQIGGGASATSAESRTEETVNYEISKKVVNHVKEIGSVNRLSVAVLVDGVYAPNGQGQRAYTPRPEQEMTQLANLVRSAIGFNAARGDTLEVINMQFAEPDTPVEAPLVLFLGLNKQDMLRMAEILVLSIVAILVILLVVRPLLTRAFEALPVASAAPAEGRLLANESMPAPALAGPSEAPDQDDFEELIDIDRVEGRVKASSVKKVGEIVDKHPSEALAIVRAWIYQET
ncbi:flagellar basal-body MS-ring/collar protein FliF [Shumkonia mesophila]|uniref:flagellar basal-body MS-ring/collar protein FliF n=1 Tax=Shumkonia mesophila TaxID=2838854 RepID=UPI002934FA5E|nr:flagellar basal-body MS-ring/collar protein FliF [Shumkonia mesophila]